MALSHKGMAIGLVVAGLGGLALAASWVWCPQDGSSTVSSRFVLHLAGVGLVAFAIFSWFLGLRGRRQLESTARALAQLAAGRTPHDLPWEGGGAAGRIAAAVHELGARSQTRLGEARAARERWRAVLQGMAEGVVVLDAAGRVELVNARARDLFRIWGDVAGRSPLEVIRRAEVDEALSRASASSEPITCEVELVTDGDPKIVQMHAVRFPEQGERLGTVAVFHDLTEIRHLETLRKEFVGNVSHELKTPLTAIRGFAETLQQSDLSEEDRQRYTDVIIRHSGRLGALIEDLLELSRIEGGRLRLASAELDLGEITRALIQDLKPRLDAAQLDCRLEVQGGGTAFADRRAVEQVLLNLLDNAIKYSEPGGTVTIEMATGADHLRVSVRDEGMGIPEEDLARIFERFYRVDKARTRDLGGTGLGLSIVKHLMQAMNGQVDLESTEGQGTTVRLTLPSQGPTPHNVTPS